ncbi:MAG: hypothetical protein IT554_01110 [Sphingomonadaceae bacterium]|nr:hypothetical protein [Sphingomonadaceae bacterium]
MKKINEGIEVNNPNTSAQWQIVTWIRLLFGLHLVYSGGAYVLLGYLPPIWGDATSMVGRFHMSLDELGLYPIVKYIELVLGLLVLTNRFVPLAAAAELPITVIISYINIFVQGPIEHRHLFTGVQELFLNVAVLVSYGAYFRTMLYPQTRPQWLWQELEAEPGHAAPASARPFTLGAPQTWAFFLIFMVLVMTASWFLGTPTRRWPPRDYVPPILAFVGMLISYRIASNLSIKPSRAG